MGLYDTPLPPYNNDEDDEHKDGNDGFVKDGLSRLFPVAKGEGGRYEPHDVPVLEITVDTGCHWTDAAFALEASGGDVAKAKALIKREQKRMLEAGVEEEESGVDWDTEWSDLVANEDRPIGGDPKKKKKNGPEWFGGVPDEPWFPGAAKGPLDDEPWFTG